MSVDVADIVTIMEAIAPAYLAEEWDNVGLQAGSLGWPVRSIWVALDPIPEVMKAACRAGVDLLITHHPLIFKPLTCVDFTSPTGRVVQLAAQNRTAVFSAHTNLDSAANGLNDLLAHKIGLRPLSALQSRASSVDAKGDDSDQAEDALGLGRIGTLEAATSLGRLADMLKKRLDLESVRVVGHPDLGVERVAICTGSGGGLIPAFLASEADVYVSGDLSYHHGRLVESMDRALIDIGHFASEHLMVADLTKRLKKALAHTGKKVSVTACALEKDPFSHI